MLIALFALLRRNLPSLWERRLVPWTGLLFGITQVWTIVDWGKLAGSIAGLPFWQRGLLSLLLTLGSAGPAQELRLPGPWERALSAPRRLFLQIPLVIAAALPLYAAALLWPGDWGLRSALWTGALLGFSGKKRPFWIFAVLMGEWNLGLGVALSMGALFLQSREPLEARWEPTGRSLNLRFLRIWFLRPLAPTVALLAQQLLLLFRTQPSTLWTALLSAVPVAGLFWGLSRHGLEGQPLGKAAAILRCMVAPLGCVAIGALLRRGRRADPPAWPVSPWRRASSWALVTLAIGFPVDLAMAATGPELGAEGWSRWGLCLLAIGGAGAAAGARALEDRWYRVNPGTHLGWCVALLGVALSPPPLAELLFLSGILFFFLDSTRRIRRARRRNG